LLGGNEVKMPRRDGHLAEAGHAALAVSQVRIRDQAIVKIRYRMANSGVGVTIA
jgi:hypothetical protein